MRSKYLIWLILFAAMPQAAHAYVDLGTGSMIVQSIMAGALGLGFFFKDRLFSILSIFKKKNK